MGEIKKPKIFISYCWTTKQHEHWVVELATRLLGDGIQVLLDKWDLKEGQDIYNFMESMVKADDVDKVLVICDKGYKDKADERVGGVGTESQIISPEIYKDANQEKFIPIIAERDGDGNVCVPVFMSSRKYIDLSNEDNYEEQYTALLRNLYKQPEMTKPTLGNPPKFLFESSPVMYKTSAIIKQLESAYLRNHQIIDGLKMQFTEEFINQLELFRIKVTSENRQAFDDVVIKAIHDMLPLRDDFISFVELECRFNNIDIDRYITLFEQLMQYISPIEPMNQWTDLDFDNYKFFIRELFLYFNCILLHNGQYKAMAEILSSTYLYRYKFNAELRTSNYGSFDSYIISLDEVRKQRLNSNRISHTADEIVSRATSKYKKRILVDMDLLLFYLGQMIYQADWFPRTYVFSDYNKNEFLQRLQSKRFFEKVKCIFRVTNADELKKMMKMIPKERYQGYPYSFEGIPSIEYHISPESIASLP